MCTVWLVYIVLGFSLIAHIFAAIGVVFPRLPAVPGEKAVAAVDLEVVYLTDDGSVQDELVRVALLTVSGTAPPVPNHRLDAAATERVAALDGYDGLHEHSAAHRAEKGLWLLYKLGRLVGRGHSCRS